MKLTAEITLYPLQDDYLTIIRGCITKINTYEGLRVETFPTATMVHGEYAKVMAMINELVEWTYNEYGRSVFVVKFIPAHELED